MDNDLEIKKRDLRLLEIRLVRTNELRKQMQKCWDLLDHDYTNDALAIENLKSEIYLAEQKGRINEQTT